MVMLAWVLMVSVVVDEALRGLGMEFAVHLQRRWILLLSRMLGSVDLQICQLLLQMAGLVLIASALSPLNGGLQLGNVGIDAVQDD